jgi:hypothetical protein
MKSSFNRSDPFEDISCYDAATNPMPIGDAGHSAHDGGTS